MKGQDFLRYNTWSFFKTFAKVSVEHFAYICMIVLEMWTS